jgi:hypothetical protein
MSASTVPIVTRQPDGRYSVEIYDGCISYAVPIQVGGRFHCGRPRQLLLSAAMSRQRQAI